MAANAAVLDIEANDKRRLHLVAVFVIRVGIALMLLLGLVLLA